MQTQKEHTSIMTEAQTQRAFIISIGTGIVMIVITLLFFIINRNMAITGIMDVRVIALGIALIGFFSAWMARIGKALIGMLLILFALYSAIIVTFLTISGVGVAAGAVAVVVTFGLTAVTFPRRLANWFNGLALAIAAFGILLDIFEPFERQPNDLVVATWAAAGFLIFVFGIYVYRQFNSYTLRTKLIIVMVTVTFAASIIQTYVGVRATTQAVSQSVGQQLYGDASSSGYQIGDQVNTQVNLLKTLSLDDLLQQSIAQHNASYGTNDLFAISSEITQHDLNWVKAPDADPFIQERLSNPVALNLKEFQSEFSDHIEVFVTDQYGALVASTQRTSDYAQADEEWWQAAYAEGQGDVYLSPIPEFDESAGAFSLLLAVPVRDSNSGALIGVLRSTFILSGLESTLGKNQIGETGEADIIFPGEQPGHIHEGDFETISYDAWNQINSVLDEKYAQVEYEGVDRVLGVSQVRSVQGDSPIDNLGWLVVLHQDTAEALAPVDQQTRGTMVISLIIIALASGIAIGLAQILSVPISRLTTVAEKVSAGDLSARANVETQDEIGRLGESFNAMTDQLQTTLLGLEDRVAERTRALETSSEVSRRLSTILDQRQLVREVVEQVQSAFDYYHAQIYLFDDKKENLILVGGTGEAGQQLLERGHKVASGRGLVGQAADSNLPVIVPDVFNREGWLSNPLLPDTKSEIAIPIAIGENVLGVLDVQDDELGGLDQADADLLASLANQVAVALQNARAYQATQRQADREALIGNINQQILSTTSFDDALKIAVRELGRALGRDTSLKLNIEQSGNGQDE